MACTESNLKLPMLTKPKSTYPHWPAPTTPTGPTHLCGCHQSLPQNNQDCLILLILASMKNSYVISVRKFERPLHITEKTSMFCLGMLTTSASTQVMEDT